MEKTSVTKHAFRITCSGCGSQVDYASVSGADAAKRKGICRNCRVDYRSKFDPAGLKKQPDGKWGCECPSCGKLRAYARKDHAKTSLRSGWKCRSCQSKLGAFSSAATGLEGNIRIGWFERFRKCAKDRQLSWTLSLEDLNDLWSKQAGLCALSGVVLTNDFKGNVSLDRIDSTKGYFVGNVQLVHKALNLMKRNMTDEVFIDWCRKVANTQSQVEVVTR